MTLSERFRVAAELIDSGEKQYCCYAINEPSYIVHFEAVYPLNDRRDVAVDLLESHDAFDVCWFGDPHKADNQTARVLALLFAAEFYEETK